MTGDEILQQLRVELDERFVGDQQRKHKTANTIDALIRERIAEALDVYHTAVQDQWL